MAQNPDDAVVLDAIVKDIESNGTTILATAGKYCDRNIAVNVNVPIPSGYIKPTGSKNITTNGTHDVTQYENAVVNVPVPSGYIKPSGNKTITENGTHDVAQFASAVVDVAGKPTQFTNLYDPANVVLKTRAECTNYTESFSADNYVNYITVYFDHKGGEEVAIRTRGLSIPVRDRQNFTCVKADGTTVVSWGQLANAITLTYDEYGDAVMTFKSGAYKSNNWGCLRLNFQYEGMNSSVTSAYTGPIITINEPIGNGGHV